MSTMHPAPARHRAAHPFRMLKERPPVYRGEFREPKREINDITLGSSSRQMLQRFIKSETYAVLMDFLLRLNASVVGKPCSTSVHESEVVKRLCGMLETMEAWVREIPPVQQPMRYGNTAFRTWIAKVEEHAEELLAGVIANEAPRECIVELKAYLNESFGSKQRIDYGTGHENLFLALLCAFDRLGLVSEEDYPAIVLRVFVRYVRLLRLLQKTYMLEPAGSHGVWGLDDYHFLPFIFGAAQLTGHPEYTPSSIHSESVLKAESDEYLYFAAIAAIGMFKRGPFGEHSPMLNDISAVQEWRKVNQGLIKMYHDEVMQKLPVMQHFPFGPQQFHAASRVDKKGQELHCVHLDLAAFRP